jgi:hypothetical protein
MSIPTTTYFYREVKGYGEYTYKLEQIIYQKGCIAYPHTFIEKNSLDVSGMARLEMFNNVFIPEVNLAASAHLYAMVGWSAWASTHG